MRDGLISSPWNLTLVGLHPVQDWAMNINTRIMNKSWPYCDMRNGSHIRSTTRLGYEYQHEDYEFHYKSWPYCDTRNGNHIALLATCQMYVFSPWGHKLQVHMILIAADNPRYGATKQ